LKAITAGTSASVTATCRKKPVAESIQPSKCPGIQSRAVLEHDPEKWKPVFPRQTPEAFARRSCSNKMNARHDIDQIGAVKKCDRQANPRGPSAAGIFIDAVGTRALLQDHRRERRDIGLQHHEQADQASQRYRMLEHEAQNRAFMSDPVGGSGGDDDRLCIDHLAHHAAR
jgi:hypothetical protein